MRPKLSFSCCFYMNNCKGEGFGGCFIFMNETSAQRGSFGPDIPADIWSKTPVGPPNPEEEKQASIAARTSCTDVHDQTLIGTIPMDQRKYVQGICPFSQSFLCNLLRKSPKKLQQVATNSEWRQLHKSCCHGSFRLRELHTLSAQNSLIQS